MTLRRLTFTIAISVRNGERFLAAAIGSALAQTRPPDEVLVVDDASTDATRAIATKAQWQGRVRYVYNQESTGFAEAFNRVTILAAREFIVLLSADDMLDVSFLENVEAGLLAHPQVKFCYVAARYIDAQGKPITARSVEFSSMRARLYEGRRYVHNYIASCVNDAQIHRCAGTVVQRRLFVEQCQFRKEAGIMADNDFFIRIAAKTDVVGIAQPLVSVRIHADAISSRMESLNLRVAQDYLYQIRFLKTEPNYVSEQDMHLVYALGYRSFDGLLHESLVRGRPDLYRAALCIIHELTSIIGFEACAKAAARTGRRGDFIYRYGFVKYLYSMLVTAASLAKRFKRFTYKIFARASTESRRNIVPLLEP